jgi:hypothetical protein
VDRNDRHERHRFACERFAKGLSLAHHIVIAIRQFNIFGREYLR